MLLNIGCDTGYGYTMSCSELGEVIFSSYIERVSESKARNIQENIEVLDENNLLVNYENEYYVLGRLCERHYMDTTRRIDLNRVGNTFHLVQLLTSIALNTKASNNVDVNLMTGLPVRSKDDRDDFKEWLEQQKFVITLMTREKEYNKVINIKECYCSLQPIFPIFSALTPEEQTQNILSLDIGYSSTDGIRFEEGAISESAQDQIDLIGTHKIQLELEEEITNKYKSTYKHLLSMSERSLQLALETGSFSINNKQLDIEDEFELAMYNYADYLFREIQRRYINKLADIDIILVSGGLACSETFMYKLAEKFREYQIIVATSNEPQWDICRGMKILLDVFEDDDFNMEINTTPGSDNTLKESDVE